MKLHGAWAPVVYIRSVSHTKTIFSSKVFC